MTTINLERVCELLKGADIDAYVEQTGGGCATILAGSPGPEGRWTACAGPGWFEGPGWTNGRGDTADFYVGADDEGEGPNLAADHTWDEERAAHEIARFVAGTNDPGACVHTPSGFVSTFHRIAPARGVGEGPWTWRTDNEHPYVWESVAKAQAWMDDVWASDPREKARSGWEVIAR